MLGYEKLKRELDFSRQMILEIARGINMEASSLTTESLENTFKHVNDMIKRLKKDDETHRKKVYEVEYEAKLMKEEISRLDEKNQKLTKKLFNSNLIINFNSETEIHNENRKLRTELEKLRDEINTQQAKVAIYCRVYKKPHTRMCYSLILFLFAFLLTISLE